MTGATGRGPASDDSGPTGVGPLSPRLDLAIRWAAAWHDGQHRKSSGVPYIQHPIAVAWMLDRLGFDEDVVIAGLLHDVVEDTEATLDDVRGRFGARVADLVGHCSEEKLDAEGRKRPWADRKREHLELLRSAPIEAKAIVLADKLHNLGSIAADLAEGREVWGRFNAGRDQIIAMARSSIEGLGLVDGDARLERLARGGLGVLSGIEGGSHRDEQPTGGDPLPTGDEPTG
ncbi:HD domain-containing protein [Tautonia plasticadhaerens]|uniref:Bifunctional (P)ppGpp synthase/hydrolase SpoT n=1 Tax=Tautonia plasticadhaerens TaxID=2527974 RepID=A0A518H0G3_9BACT|nr:HD domain-containing protein [Tautonia plasticadhaerens]QDV34332.1 Bifunctional (p)ppGpp synthase/hydrolase SpoT [Tautonia plasticadhaerens]